MKRWIAGWFLVLIAFYVGGALADHCEDRPGDDVQVCHILCNDGCAAAPLPVPPTPPPADGLPTPSFEVGRVEHLVSLEPEPEKEPPRA